MSNKRLFLQTTFKTLTAIAILWTVYVFTAAFFSSDEQAQETQREFDLSSLSHNSAIYFKHNNRELLAIKTNEKYSVFWANDPIYGCRLEYFENIIKPVCIDIEYDMNGYNENKNQQLLMPDYKVTQQNTLIVY